MKKRRNTLMMAIALGGIIGLVGCTPEPKATQPEPEVTNILKEDVPEVQWEVLKPSLFRHDIMSNGLLRSKNRVEVRWEVSSRIVHIGVKNGDYVKRGQLLAEADAQKLRLSLQQANNSKKQAYLEMQDFMIGQGYKLNEMENAPEEIKQLAVIKSGYRQAELACESAEISLREAILQAPIAGVVANLTAKLHNKTSNDVFCTLLDNSTMEATFSIMEQEMSNLKHGDEVLFSLFGGSEEHVGHVTEINPMVNANGLVEVKGEVTRVPEGWFDGMKVNIKVRKTVGMKLVVPKKAVVMRDNRWVVFTLKQDRAYWNYVSVGQENSDSYVIENGLNEGDSIIVEGNLNLAHFSMIKMKP